METITIQFDDSKNIPLIMNLLKNLNIDLKIDVEKSRKAIIHFDPPVQWASGKPSITDFSGFWKDRSIKLEELRGKAWKRN